jgi:hypothetical protein
LVHADSTTGRGEIRQVVRDARAKDPLIRVAGLKAVLEKQFDLGFSHQYVSKIADKVVHEGLVEVDRTQIEERMQFTRENHRMMREEPLKIVYLKDGDSGSNENTNGLLRQYFPRGTDFSRIPQIYLNAIALRLNQRPRKTLGFETPADRLQAVLH